MAWTYTADFAIPRDKVRLLLGDVTSADAHCSDDEVAFALAEESGNVYRAAAYLADRLAARFAGDEAISVPGLSLSGGAQRSAAFRALAAALRAEAQQRGGALVAAKPGGGAVVVTGARISTMQEAACDPERPRPAFRREQSVPPCEDIVL